MESLLLADPALAERFVFAGVSACVSAPDGDAALDRYPEAPRQIAVVDLIVLTRTDLAAAPPSLDERLRLLNPRAERATAVFGRLRTPHGVTRVDLGIRGGRVAAVAELGSLVGAGRTIDARGRIVMPGGIDPHVRCAWRIPAIEGGEAQLTGPPATLSRAALFGGTTPRAGAGG